MFKRPRNHREAAMVPQSRTKRLKEDSRACQDVRQDYVNITYPLKRKVGDLLERGRVVSELATEADQSISQERARYNRLKLQHKRAKYEPRLVHSCTSQWESDNSSIASEATEAEPVNSEEREHYNKLKVDVNKMMTNKKLLKGVKVLSAQSSAQVAGIDYLIPDHHMKYKKEGHANQLHSVRAFQSDTRPSSLLPKSRSTGDIVDTGYSSSMHKLTHSKSSHNIESTTETRARERGSASVKPDPQLQATHRHHISSISELTFINKTITFTCAHEGKEITSSAYGFSVNIPKGTVRKRKVTEFNVGVCLNGPFSFPSGYKLVSPILMVTSPTHNKLKKPIEVVLSHCVEITPQTRKEEGVAFFRAKKMKNNLYHFEPTNSDTNNLEIHNDHGKLASTELGFFCIMSKEMTETRTQTRYCLIPVVPKVVEAASWRVHYCLTLHLQAFVKEIEEHFGPNWEVLTPKPFKLEARVGAQNQEKIEINFQRILPECGWTLALKSESKIHTSDIDSWTNKCLGDGPTQLQPPRFTIRVCGNHATSSSEAQIWFTGPGMCQDLTTQVNLPLTSTPPSSVQSPNPESTSSFSSSSFFLSSAMGSSLLSSSDYDHLPSQEELNQTHSQLTYHNGCIDFPTDTDLETVAYEVIQVTGKYWTKLQTSLDIPQYVMKDILNQPTEQQQVFRLLKEWRQHTQDSSKKELAKCLRSVNTRFSKAADVLLRH